MPGKRFFITPNGNCSVFHSTQHPAQLQTARLAANSAPTVEGWTLSSAYGGPGNLRAEDLPERLRPWTSDRPPRLKPLLGQAPELPRLKGAPRRKRPPKAALTDLAPWEAAELEYVEGMKRPSRSQQLCAALLERYCEPSKEPVNGFALGSPLPAVPDDSAAISTGVPLRPKTVDRGALRTPMAPTNSAPPMLLPSTPSTPRTAESSRLLPVSTPLKHAVFSRVTPLTLPGMKSVPQTQSPNFMAITPVAMADKFAMEGEAEQVSSPSQIVDSHDQRKAARRKKLAGALSRTRWAVLSPFFSFLARPHAGKSSEDENIEPASPTSLFGAHRSDGPADNQQTQSASWHSEAAADNNPSGNFTGKTLGLLDGMQRWLSVGDQSNAKMLQHSPLANEMTSAGDKAEIRSLIVMAKKYNLPVSDVREMKREFGELDKEGNGEISWGDFQSLIRKRGNLDPDKEIPAHLLQGMADRHTAFGQAGNDAAGHDVGFEEYLRWTIQTAWTEEMLMPYPEERQIRQLARDQRMLLPDVERVKQIFDQFDTDGSGEIEEEEFQHILYKMLHVRDVTDVPIKRLKRYWREVDLDGSGSIGFNEFLIWYKTSFSKDGKIDLG